MATKNKKSTPKNNKPQKAAVEEKKAPLIAENKQVEVEPVKIEHADTKITPEPPKDSPKTVKILGRNLKISSLINTIGLIASIMGIIGISLLDVLPKNKTPTPTPASYIIVPINPTPQPTKSSYGAPASSDPSPSAGQVSAQALPLYEFHGNEFTAKQVQCMTPTVLPVSGAKSAQFLPGGHALAVEMRGEQKVGIWDLQKNNWTKFMKGIELAQSPYGPLFLRDSGEYVNNDWQVQVVHAADESVILTVPGWLTGPLAVAPDGRKIAIGFDDGEVQVWDISAGTSTVFLGDVYAIEKLFFSPDGSLLASQSGAGPISVWDISSVSTLATQPKGEIYEFTADSRELLYWNESTLWEWDVKTRQTRKLVSTPENFEPNYIQAKLSPNGSVLILDDTLWNMPQNTLLRHLKEHSASKLAWAGSFEGDKLVTTSENEIIVWDLTCAGPPPTPVTASDFKPITAGNIENLKLAHNFTEGNMVAFATKSNFFIMGTKVYSLADMKPISDFGENQIDENMGSAISPDGKYLALPNYEGKLLIWDVANNYPMQALEGCAFMPIFLPDGRLVARNVINIDQEACIWKDLHGTVKKISYPHGFEDLVSLPSGVYLSTHGYSGKFGLKDLFAKGVDATYLFSDHMESEVFSPNGKFLAAINSNDYTYWVFDAAKQSLEKQFSQLFSYAAFSYDEKLMAAMSISDHLLKVYGTKDWEPLFELQAESDVNKLVFSPDGHYLVLSGGGKAQFWSVDGK